MPDPFSSPLMRVNSGPDVAEYPHYEIHYWYGTGGMGPAQGAVNLWFSPDSESLVSIDDVAAAVVQLLANLSTGGPTGNGVTAYQAIKYDQTQSGSKVVK